MQPSVHRGILSQAVKDECCSPQYPECQDVRNPAKGLSPTAALTLKGLANQPLDTRKHQKMLDVQDALGLRFHSVVLVSWLQRLVFKTENVVRNRTSTLIISIQ